MSLEKLEELVTSLISKIIFPWNFFHMYVLWLSLIYIMGIVGVFRSKRLAEVWVEHLWINVSVIYPHVIIDVILMCEVIRIKEHWVDLRSCYPSKTLGIKNGKSIYKVEIWTLSQCHFSLLKLLLVLDHVKEKLNKVSFILGTKWPIVSFWSSCDWDRSRMNYLCLDWKWSIVDVCGIC